MLESVLANVDKTLDPSLSATLAGLSLTAAIFVISYNSGIASNIMGIIRMGGTPAAPTVNALGLAEKAVKKLFLSFLAFVLVLINGIASDSVMNLHMSAAHYAIFDEIGGGFSGGMTAAGLILFWSGADIIYKTFQISCEEVRKGQNDLQSAISMTRHSK